MRSKVTRTAPLSDPRLTRGVQILQLAYRSDGVTRAEISELTGLSPTVVVRLVGKLVERGLLTAGGFVERPSRGRPSELLNIAPEAGYSVGLEFGRAHLLVTIVDATGTVRHTNLLPEAPEFTATQATVEALAQVIRSECGAASVPWDLVRSVGIALHDVVDAEGRWLTQAALDIEPMPISALLGERLDRLVLAEDVSRAFALAEHRDGAAKGKDDAIYLFVGSHGVGSGIFVNGELLRSTLGVCGEVGHLVVEPDGVQCVCGNRGCLETVASHERVVERFLALARAGIATSLDWEAGVTFTATCEAARDGDKVASLVLEELVVHLARALASVVNISGATHIVIGGQLASAGQPFLDRLMAELRLRSLALLGRQMSVAFASLPAHAGAWGVGVQALEEAIAQGRFLTVDPAVEAEK